LTSSTQFHVERRIENSTHRCNARVEADEVHTSEALHRLVAQSLHPFDGSHIAPHAHDAVPVAAQPGDGRVERGGLDVADRDAHSGGLEAVRERASDAAASAGHDTYLVGEISQ
jgi:hypothetical protein